MIIFIRYYGNKNRHIHKCLFLQTYTENKRAEKNKHI